MMTLGGSAGSAVGMLFTTGPSWLLPPLLLLLLLLLQLLLWLL